MLARRHGAYSSLELRARSLDFCGEIRDALPLYSPADEPAVRMLAMALARLERANLALEEVDEVLAARPGGGYFSEKGERLDALRRDMRAWMGTAMKLCGELGMTPSSRARLGLDVALAQRASEQAVDRLLETGREIRERRGDES
jgi:hypothetical protein